MIAGRLTTWAAAQHGARTAVVFGEQRYSHAEIEARSNRFAQAALALGLQPGERLAVLREFCLYSSLSMAESITLRSDR